MALIGRRQFLCSLSATAAAHRVVAQETSPRAIRVRALNQIGLAVTDPQRSLAFYQELWGMPIQARHGSTTVLRIGDGPQLLSITQATATPPGIRHFGFAVEHFDPARVLQVLRRNGVAEAQSTGDEQILRALTVRRSIRGSGAGQTEGLQLADPDGILVQLQDPSYCGGGGALGNVCVSVEPSPHKGLFAVRDVNHFTINVSDPVRSRAFYQGLFGFGIRAYQGPTTPTLAVGSGTQFVVFNTGSNSTGEGGRAALVGPPRIHHACLTMERFDADSVQQTLERYGLRQGNSRSGPVPPFHYYVSMRMPARGGAPEGTPELYVTDPDGIPIQLQDVRYCGGAGVLGERCR